LYSKYYSGEKIKKNEMGWACGTCGGEARCIEGFGGGKLKEKGYFENIGTDGRVMLK
jgi:hypothetical protein